MDSSTAGLIGVGIGAVVSLVTVFLTPHMNARLTKQQFAREAENEEARCLASRERSG
jgi:hypothetical protein